MKEDRKKAAWEGKEQIESGSGLTEDREETGLRRKESNGLKRGGEEPDRKRKAGGSCGMWPDMKCRLYTDIRRIQEGKET